MSSSGGADLPRSEEILPPEARKPLPMADRLSLPKYRHLVVRRWVPEMDVPPAISDARVGSHGLCSRFQALTSKRKARRTAGEGLGRRGNSARQLGLCRGLALISFASNPSLPHVRSSVSDGGRHIRRSSCAAANPRASADRRC